MKSLSLSLLTLFVLIASSSLARAADGTFRPSSSDATHQSWSSTSNWVSGRLPSGDGSTAYFSDSNPYYHFIDVNTSPEIGHLEFSGHNAKWWLQPVSSANVIKLSDGSDVPTITVNDCSVRIGVKMDTQDSGLMMLGRGQTDLEGDSGVSGGGMFYVGQRKVSVDGAKQFGSSGAGNETMIYNLCQLIIESGSSGDINNIAEDFIIIGRGPGGEQALEIREGINLSGTIRARSDTYILKRTAYSSVSSTISGNITLENQAEFRLDVLESGLIVSGNISGAGGYVRKTGASWLSLSGNNSYTGGTVIDTGRVDVSSDVNLGDASGGVTIKGATLRIKGTSYASTNRAFEFGSGGAVLDIEDVNHIFTIGDSITGTGALTKSGAGTLVLSSANTFSGATTVTAGSLRVTHSLALQNSTVELSSGVSLMSTNATLGGITGAEDYALPTNMVLTVGGNDESTTYSGVLSGSNAGLVKAGSGTLTLSGNNTRNGTITLQGGVLSIASEANLGVGDVTFNGGALRLTGQSMTTGRAFAFDAAGGEIELPSQTSAMILTAGLTGTGDLAKSGPGTLSLEAANSGYTGDITVLDGVLRAGKSDSLGDATRVTVNSTGTLTMDGAERFGSLAGESGAIVDLVVSDISVGVDNRDATFSGSITGDGSLTKIGSGRMVMDGSNTYTNGTNVNAGTLVLRGNNASMPGTITVKDGATLVAGLSNSLGTPIGVDVLSGGTFRLEGGETFGWISGAGDVDTAGHGLGVGDDNSDMEFSGVIYGAGLLTKNGIGTLTLSGNNAFTGGTNVRAGTLRLIGNNDFMTGLISVYDGATLLAGIRGSLGANAQVNIADGGTFRLEDVEAFGSISGAGHLDTVIYNIAVGADDGDSEFSGLISGSGYLRKLGSGTLTLSGGNTHTGGTRLTEGTLLIAHDSAMGDGVVYFDGGELMIADGVTIANAFDFTTYGQGGTLCGSGTVAGNVTLGAGMSVAPGNSPGLLTIDGDYTPQSDSVLVMELAGLARGDEYDALVITGQATLDGTLEVRLLDDFTPNEDDVFDILDWTTLAGGSEFHSFILPELADGLGWDTSELHTDGTLAVIPEPASLLLLAAGLPALLKRRRRRR